MRLTLISTDPAIAAHGMRSLSAVAREAGCETRLLFLPTLATSYTERALDAVREAARGSDLIGVSSMAFSSKKAQQAMAALRPLGVPIVWGGVHASTAPEHCTPHHDLLCVGEGEGPLLDLLSAVDDKRSFAAIPNLWVREGDAWRRNPVRPQEADLNKLPPPDFELERHLLLEGDRLVPFARRHFYYGAHNCSSEHCLDFGEYALLQTSRGCPFKCSFCSYSALHDLYKGEAPIRLQSVEKSIADLLHVRKRLPFLRFLWFTDDTFFVREAAELREWCAAYRRHVGLPFAVYTDPITFREDKLQWLIDAGLYHVTVGIQSGSARSGQQVYDRLIRPGEIGHLARVVNKYVGRMHAPLYQVIGLSPFEDEADLLATIHVILSLPPPFQLDCFGLKFFPGTPLYERAAASGWMDETDEQAYNSPYSDYSRMLEHRLGRIARPDLHRLLHSLGGAHTRLFAGSVPRALAGHVRSEAGRLSDDALGLRWLDRLPPTKEDLYYRVGPRGQAFFLSAFAAAGRLRAAKNGAMRALGLDRRYSFGE